MVPIAFLHPRHWLTWAGIGALRCLELLPFAAQRSVAKVLGAVIARLPLAYIRIAARNIALCMPELCAAQRRVLISNHCRSLGMGLCETACTWWSSDARVASVAELQGLEHLRAALAKGRGAILIGGHFTTIEIATRVLGTAVPMNMVYRPPKNPLLSYVMHASFCRHGNPIRHDDIRAMLRALKNNEAVWYAPDQSFRNKGAAMVDFFGIPAATATATSRLARISKAPVLTYFPERLPCSKRYRLVIGPELENFPSCDAAQDALRFNVLLQAQIRKVPEQYLWMHRRFKGLSPDYPDYYGQDARAGCAAERQASDHGGTATVSALRSRSSRI